MRKWKKNAEEPRKEQDPDTQNLCSVEIPLYLFIIMSKKYELKYLLLAERVKREGLEL